MRESRPRTEGERRRRRVVAGPGRELERSRVGTRPGKGGGSALMVSPLASLGIR